MVCNVVVELYATSPYVYGDAPRETVVRSYEREADMSGLTFPAAVPWLVQGSGEAPADPITWLTQFGSVAARPQVVITAGASPTLWDDSTGQFFSVDWDGDIVIDRDDDARRRHYGAREGWFCVAGVRSRASPTEADEP
jgi:hypothetical protein